MKFLVVWWYNYNKKYHMVLVIRFLDKVISLIPQHFDLTLFIST